MISLWPLVGGWGLAQGSILAADPNNTPTTVLGAVILLGSAIVGGLCLALRAVWKENNDLRSGYVSVLETSAAKQETALKEQIAVSVTASNRIKDSERTLDQVNNLLTQLLQHQVTPTQVEELNFLLRAIREEQRKKP